MLFGPFLESQAHPVSSSSRHQREPGQDQVDLGPTEGIGDLTRSPNRERTADVADPIERLNKIHDNTLSGKTYQGAIGAKSLADLAETVPFGVANLAAKVYSRYGMAKMHKPVFNLVITNVPGPQMPIYLQGHQLLSVMGMAPIIDGMGLIITVFSYNGLHTEGNSKSLGSSFRRVGDN